MYSSDPYDVYVGARLLDFFRSDAPWQRGLWCSGLLLTLREVLEAAEAVPSNILSQAALSYLVENAVSLSGRDCGLNSTAQKGLLINALKGNLIPGGVAYCSISQIINDVQSRYLQNWANATTRSDRPSPERAARAIAAHLLDTGFSLTFLHRWCTYQIRDSGGSSGLAELVRRAEKLSLRGPKKYKVLVGCHNVPNARSGPPANFLSARDFSDWLRQQGHSVGGVRHNGALLFQAEAMDPVMAIQRVVETVTLLESRVALGTKTQLRTIEQAWIEGYDKSLPFRPENRRVEVHALHREDKLYTVERGSVDAALELLGPLNSGAPSPAVGAGWAAVESLLSGPGDDDVLAADRLASIVACSLPRAELTELSFRVEDQGGAVAASLKACSTNRDRAAFVAGEIRKGIRFTFPDHSDNAALERVTKLINAPKVVLAEVQGYVKSAFRRMYRNRNLVLHGGRIDAVGLRPTLRTGAPLIGAGMDRLAHSWFVNNVRPMDMAAKAQIALATVGTTGAQDIVDLLE